MCVVCVVNDSVVNYLRQATTYCLYKEFPFGIEDKLNIFIL